MQDAVFFNTITLNDGSSPDAETFRVVIVKNTDTSSNGLSGGAIAGVVIAAIIVVAIVGVVVVKRKTLFSNRVENDGQREMFNNRVKNDDE